MDHMDQKDLDIARLTIESKLQASKTELEQLKAELAKQVAEARIAIGDTAIDKMSKAFTEFRNWMGVGALILGISGFFGYQNLASNVEKTVSSRIDAWLSFEKKGAILKDTLETERMRVTMDALVVRLERAKLAEHYAPELELADSEKSRLVAYMLEPTTSDLDFRDGTRVLAGHFGPFFFGDDPKVDELFAAYVAPNRSNPFRLNILLQTLKGYRPAAAYAQAILDHPELPGNDRQVALRALESTDSTAAEAYARAHLGTETFAALAQEEAEVLATLPADQAKVDTWLGKQSGPDAGIRPALILADKIAPLADSSLGFADPASKDWAIKRTAALVVTAIQNGARVVVNDSMNERSLAFRGQVAWGIENPEILFDKNDLLLKAIADTANARRIAPQVLVSALTTKSSRGEIFALQANLNKASLTGATFGTIDSSTAASPVMLMAIGGTNPMQASFRSRDGRWIEDRITSFQRFQDATLHFAYDEAFLQLARSKHLNNLSN